VTIQQAKQVALFVAVAGATVYKFLEEIEAPKVQVITSARRRSSR
jgi:hypothetical protein